MLHKVHPGSNTGMYFVVLYHSLARICRKTVVKLNHQTGRNAGISGASGQCSGPAVLTDRDELNKQISETFENCGLLGKAKAGQFMATSGDDLIAKLRGNPSFIFTLMVAIICAV